MCLFGVMGIRVHEMGDESSHAGQAARGSSSSRLGTSPMLPPDALIGFSPALLPLPPLPSPPLRFPSTPSVTKALLVATPEDALAIDASAFASLPAPLQHAVLRTVARFVEATPTLAVRSAEERSEGCGWEGISPPTRLWPCGSM